MSLIVQAIPKRFEGGAVRNGCGMKAKDQSNLHLDTVGDGMLIDLCYSKIDMSVLPRGHKLQYSYRDLWNVINLEYKFTE